ncbi:two-component response regulator ARR2-like protein [Tanacetum coccineum]
MSMGASSLATVCNRAETGLSLLRENKNGYDIVLSDVHMPDMDGFKLLEHIGLEMDLPVITDVGCEVVGRVSTPRLVELNQKVPDDGDHSSSANKGHNWRNVKKRKDEEEDECEEREESFSSKKPRVVWSVELLHLSCHAVKQLEAVPKKILELMNVPGLSRENVASQYSKYRLYLRRLNGSQHMGSMNDSFMDSPEAGYRSMSSVNGFDLQTMTGAGQFPGQSFATLRAAMLGRSNNIFSFENQKMQYGQVNKSQPLHGIPTNMGPNQFVGLRQSRQNSELKLPSGGGLFLSYSMLNDSGFQDSYTSHKKMGSIVPFSADDGSVTHLNGARNDKMRYAEEYNQGWASGCNYYGPCSSIIIFRSQEGFRTGGKRSLAMMGTLWNDLPGLT